MPKFTLCQMGRLPTHDIQIHIYMQTYVHLFNTDNLVLSMVCLYEIEYNWFVKC